jgi:large subunit ribosomal protein L24
MMQNTKRVKNPGKQRKRLFNAPAHIRHKLMSAPLSRELTASRGAKTLPVRKGDTILIKRGDNKGFEGKVSRVDLKAFRIYVEGLTREKVDGTNIFLPIHPSKVEIRNLNLDDKWRKNILERKKVVEKPAKADKPKAKLAKKAEKAPAKEEKPVQVVTIEEEAAPEVAKEPVAEMITKIPAPKKAEAKKPKTASAKEEKAPTAKKATKKAPAAKEAEEEEAAPKAKAKPKASGKTKGGQ